MSHSGQNRPFAERRPNDCFPIRKRPLAKDAMNGRSWPKVALRRHRKSDRLCDSNEGLESTLIGHSRSTAGMSAIGPQSGRSSAATSWAAPSHNPTLDPRIRRLRIALRVAIGRLSILGRQWPRERRLRHPRLLPLVGRHRGSGGPQREYRRGRLPRLCPGARPSPGRATGERVRLPP